MKKHEKELKQRYIDITMEESWHNDSGMRKHFEKSIDRVVETEKGYLIALDKPTIEKDFCFGYSLSRYGDDGSFDRANEMAAHAATSEDYFINENMKQIDRKLESLKKSHFKLYTGVKFCDAPRDSVIHYYTLVHEFDVELGEVREGLIEATEEDRKRLIAAYEEMKKDFAKRLQTYLKRYGLSNVNTWSYWKDA